MIDYLWSSLESQKDPKKCSSARRVGPLSISLIVLSTRSPFVSPFQLSQRVGDDNDDEDAAAAAAATVADQNDNSGKNGDPEDDGLLC